MSEISIFQLVSVAEQAGFKSHFVSFSLGEAHIANFKEPIKLEKFACRSGPIKKIE